MALSSRSRMKRRRRRRRRRRGEVYRKRGCPEGHLNWCFLRR